MHTGVWKTRYTKSNSWTCCGSKDKKSTECGQTKTAARENREEQVAKERWKRGKPTESDIIARVEAAENKITQNIAETSTTYGGVYYGQMEGGRKHGYGTYTSANGGKYVGGWKNDKKDGNGTYTYADGNKYFGEFKNGKKDGNGTFTFADGDKYVGEFKNGKKDGQGTFTFADGRKYVGEFKNNKMHGQGTFTFTDGSKYVGGWQNSKRNGNGTQTFADGTIESEGVYVDDVCTLPGATI